MISNEPAKQLYDNINRGESIPVEELSQLEEWYTDQDQIESAQFVTSNSKKMKRKFADPNSYY